MARPRVSEDCQRATMIQAGQQMVARGEPPATPHQAAPGGRWQVNGAEWLAVSGEVAVSRVTRGVSVMAACHNQSVPSIDLSSPGIIALFGVIIAGVFGYLGARTGAKIGADAAATAARISQQEGHADRAEARAARFADRKLTLAVDLLLAADQHRREADQLVTAKWRRWEEDQTYGIEQGAPLPPVGPTEPVRIAYLALDLVAPAMAGEAAGLYRATLPMAGLAAGWSEPIAGDDRYGEWTKSWNLAVGTWDEARHQFVGVVRSDLGVNPDEA